MSFSSLEKFKDLKLEEIYHVELQYWLRIFTDFVFIASVFIYFLTSYIVLKKSTTKMGKFRYTVFAQMTFNILYDFVIFIINPVLIWPLPMISSYSHFPLKREWFFGIVGILIFVVAGGIFAFMLSFSYRVTAVFSSSSYGSKKITNLGIALLFAFVIASTNVPLYFVSRNPDDLQRYFEADIPALKQLYEYLPITIGIHPQLTNGWLYALQSAFVTWIICDGFLLILFNVAFIYRLKKIEKRVSKETFLLHKMLHRALLTQVLGATLFAAVPVIIIIVTFLFEFRHGSWIANFAFPLTTLHVTFDSLCLLYFVKPYRKFISRAFNFLFLPKPSRKATISFINYFHPENATF